MSASPLKNTIVVPDILPGLGIAVRFAVRPYTLDVPDAGGTLTTKRLRLFLPEGIEIGRPAFVDAIATRLVAAGGRLPPSVYFDCQRWVSAILLQDIKSRLDPRRRRTFMLSSLRASEKSVGKRRKYDTFNELRRQPELRDLTNLELLLKLAGETSEGTVDLIEQAIFLKPVIELTESFKQLLKFDHDVKGQRDELHQLITEVIKVFGNGSQVDTKQAKPVRIARGILFDVFGSTLATRESKRPPITLPKPDIAAVDLPAECENAWKRFSSVEEHLSQYDEMISLVRSHLQPIAKALGQQSISALLRDDRLAIVDERLGVDVVNELLARIIHVYDEEGKARKRKRHDRLRVAPLKKVLENGDRLQKWCEILFCTQHMLLHREYARLSLRNAIRRYHLMLGYVFLLAYRSLRGQMTAAEKRAFLLMYLPHPELGHLVPAFDPVLRGFWKGMNKETRGLLLEVVALRQMEREGDLDRRWRSYLRAFPSWTEIVQDEDRLEKKRKEESLEKPALGKGGAGMTLRDLVPDEKAEDIDSEMEFQAYLDNYCSPKQRERMNKYFREGKTHQEIASEEGVSQVAITKSINHVLERIAEDVTLRSE